MSNVFQNQADPGLEGAVCQWRATTLLNVLK
jgi:hypothetical protein